MEEQRFAYWRVRGINSAGVGEWTAARFLHVTSDAVPGVPSLQSPIDNSDVPANQPIELVFSQVSNSVTRYQISIFDQNTGSRSYPVVQADSICDNGVCRTTIFGLDAQSSVIWRVRAFNSAGWGAWSFSEFFNVAELDENINDARSLVADSVDGTNTTTREVISASQDGSITAFSRNNNVFVHDRNTNITKALTPESRVIGPTSGSQVAVSGNGEFIAFSSSLLNDSSFRQVYLYEVATEATTLLSRGSVSYTHLTLPTKRIV